MAVSGRHPDFAGTVANLRLILPAPDRCGTCTRCIAACPTQAIVAPGELDARLCISYLTIEKRGEIPEDLALRMGRHVFGCDICQDVCPWNRKAPVTAADEFQPREGLVNPRARLAGGNAAGGISQRRFADRPAARQAFRPAAQCGDRHGKQRRQEICADIAEAGGRCGLDCGRAREVGTEIDQCRVKVSRLV